MQTETTHSKRSTLYTLIPVLRLEGFAIGLAAIFTYAGLEQSWTQFAIFFLVPDLAMLGYAFGPRVGAIAYNAMHSYIGPAAIGMISWLSGGSEAYALATIWVAHIGLDRAIGYGLKLRLGFKTTHLTPQVPH